MGSSETYVSASLLVSENAGKLVPWQFWMEMEEIIIIISSARISINQGGQMSVSHSVSQSDDDDDDDDEMMSVF